MQHTKTFSIKVLFRVIVLAIIITVSSATMCTTDGIIMYTVEVYLDSDIGKDNLLLLATRKDDISRIATTTLRKNKRVPLSTGVSGHNHMMYAGDGPWPEEDVLFSFLYRQGKQVILTLLDPEDNAELCRWDYDSPNPSERAFFDVDNWSCTTLDDEMVRFVFTVNKDVL